MTTIGSSGAIEIFYGISLPTLQYNVAAPLTTKSFAERLAVVTSQQIQDQLKIAVETHCPTFANQVLVPVGMAPLGPGFNKERMQEEVAGSPKMTHHSKEGII